MTPDYNGRNYSLQHQFSYHAPKGTQIERYQKLRDKALEFAELIMACCPHSADRSAAIRKVREAVMTANASIAINEH